MREMLIGAIVEEAMRINCIEDMNVVLTLTKEKEMIIEYDRLDEDYWKQWVISSKNNEKYLNGVLEELKGIK